MAWPAGLPAPLLAGYGFSEELPTLRTQMESGPDRVVRISTGYLTTVQLSLSVTPALLQTFREYFHGSECNAGANWIDIPIITTNTKQNHECRITAWSTTRNGTRWTLNLTVETEEHLA